MLSMKESKALLSYCLAKPGAFEDYPFGPEVIVVKVAGKMFALLSRREDRFNIALKCDPYLAVLLRNGHQCITPGYHLDKRHWNTVILDGSLPENQILQMIDHSYELVVKSLSRKQQSKLEGLSETVRQAGLDQKAEGERVREGSAYEGAD